MHYTNAYNNLYIHVHMAGQSCLALYMRSQMLLPPGELGGLIRWVSEFGLGSTVQHPIQISNLLLTHVHNILS